MHFTKIFATSVLLLATGLSASASPAPVAVAEYKQVGRRYSRKAIQRRHWYHHHHNNGTASTQPTPSTSNSTDTGDDNGNCDDQPEVVTIYTTIYTDASGGQATPTDSAAPTDTAAPTNGNGTPTTTTTGAPAASNGNGNGPSNSGAVIQATGSQCGDPNAVPTPAATSGPNGDENWLNCGVDGNGWNPPPVTLDNLIYRDLSEVLNEDGNPFSACQPYLQFFQDQATNTGIPEIYLASIALQESGCNPSVTGGAGEIGMMQITGEKCPTDGTSCYDAEANIRIGAEYLLTVINDQCNGNVACAMGAYNGWYVGLTVAGANDYSTCAQHNNLDYLQNVFNGYLQGVDPASLNMGIYHNTC